MKKITVKSAMSFHCIREEEIAAVMSIADRCFTEIGVDPEGGNRIFSKAPVFPLWEKEMMNVFLNGATQVPKVLTVDRKVVGYLFCTVLDTAVTIDQLAVAPTHQRNGYEMQMLRKLKRSMADLRRDKIEVSVAERNLAAQLLFRENGFRWFQTNSGPNTGQDSYLMQWRSPVS